MYTSARNYKRDLTNEQHYEQESSIPSMTQPDMVLSLQQLLTDHTRGLQVPIMSLNYSEFTENIPSFGKLDKIEQTQIIRNLKKSNKKNHDFYILQQETEKMEKEKMDKPSENTDNQSPTDTNNLS